MLKVVDLNIGETIKLRAEVIPSNATKSSVSWNIKGSEYIDFKPNGADATVRALRSLSTLNKATVEIEASAGGKKDIFKINIRPNPIRISFNSFENTLLVGQTSSVLATVYPADANQAYNLSLESNSNPKAAELIGSNQITAIAEGTVTIKATAARHSNVTATKVIKVKAGAKIYLSPENKNKSYDHPDFKFYGYERDQMILLTNEVSTYLSNLGYDVIVGFNAEPSINNNYAEERREESNEMYNSNPNGTNLHVCIHSNAGSPGIQTIFGPEIYYQNESNKNHFASKNFAQSVYNKLFALYQESFPETQKRQGNGLIEDGKKGYIELQTKATAIYVETAFHDNLEDAHWIVDNRVDIAKAIGDGIIEYLNSL